MTRWLAFLCSVLLLTNTPAATAGDKTQLFIQDVRLVGFSKETANWGPALAEDVRGVLLSHSNYSPLTLATLKAQLGKERFKETLACQENRGCLLRIVENFGCSESVFVTVTRLSDDEAQIMITHSGGGRQIKARGPLYAKPKLKAIRDRLRRATAALFELERVASDEVSGELGPVSEASSEIIIKVTPGEDVTLELQGPGGETVVSAAPYRNPRAKPGIWLVKAVAPGYAPLTRNFKAPPDDVILMRLKLVKLGSIVIGGAPAGTRVIVTGPGGYRQEGGAPGTLKNLVPGIYHLRVQRGGSPDRNMDVEVGSGATVDVRLDGVRPQSPAEKAVLIPAGWFWMGCNLALRDQCSYSEKPYHRVYLDSFRIDRTEVTNQDFAMFLQAHGNDCGVRECRRFRRKDVLMQVSGRWMVQEGLAQHPVVKVTWYGAKAYCEWSGGTLPTEAQWERAARGTEGRNQPWGNREPSCELTVIADRSDWGCGTGEVMPVCTKKLGNTPEGLCDMAGNVWEWMSDWYDAEYYKKSPRKNPTGPENGSRKVLRGGSYMNLADQIAVSTRVSALQRVGSDNTGFRCVYRDSKPPRTTLRGFFEGFPDSLQDGLKNVFRGLLRLPGGIRHLI